MHQRPSLFTQPAPGILRAGLATLAILALSLLSACSGGQATLPPPTPLGLVVESPGEGMRLNVPVADIRGRVAAAGAIVGMNGKPLNVSTDGRFATTAELQEGTNTFVFEGWPASASGRGSVLLPNVAPSERIIRTVTFAWPELALQVNAPIEGQGVSSAQISASGRVSEFDATLAINGQSIALDANGSFNSTRTLQEGANTLIFEATSKDGKRHATVLRHVTYTPANLMVQITEPTEGLITNAASILVKGRASVAATSIRVQGQAVTPDAGGHFQIQIMPSEGPLTVLAEATGADGAHGQDTRHLIIDRTPPFIRLNPAPPALTRAGQLTMAGQVDDATACMLQLQNAPVPLDPARKFNSSATLNEGLNTLHLQALDSAGNIGTLDVRVERDGSGPALHIVPALPASTIQTSIVVTGWADDLHGVAGLDREGASLAADGQGHFSFVWNLALGANQTVLHTADTLGNESSLILQVLRIDPPPPPLTLAVLTPADGSTVSDPNLAVSGSVSDVSALVTVNGQPLSVAGSGAFSGVVILNSGPNLLQFLATASGGRSAGVTRNVNYVPPVASRVRILEPAEGLRTKAAQITVKGRVDQASDAVKVQGLVVTVDASGAFQTQLTPPEGPLTIRADSTNKYGLPGNDERHIVIDRTAPSIHIVPAMPASSAQTSIVVTGWADDLHGVASLSRDGASLAADGTWHFSFIWNLVPGANQTVLRAMDTVGNESSLVLQVLRIDPPPPTLTLAVLTPADGSTVSDPNLAVSGSVSDASATVTVNGQPLSVSGSGAFSGMVILNSGPSILQFLATASDGRSASATRNVTFVPPVASRVHLLEPAEGLLTKAAQITVKGRVDKASDTVKVQGQVVSVDASGAFQTQLTPPEGPFTIRADSTNTNGPPGSDERHIVIDRTAPSIHILPALPASTAQTSLVVTGWADDLHGVASLARDGATLSADGTWHFSFIWNLVPGANQTTLSAKDTPGNESSLPLQLQCTYTPPPPALTLAVTEPTDGAVSSLNAIHTSGTVSETGASVDVNGVAMVMAGIAFSGDVPLQPGENVLVYTASLPDGRSASDTRAVTKPTGGGGPGGVPIVTITTPMDGFGTNQHALTVQGSVDDPKATLILYGKAVPLDATGAFQLAITSDKEGIVKIAAEATNAYGKGEAAVYVHFDWTVPVLAWIAPTPADGARLTTRQITAAVGVNEPVLASINGQSAPLEPSDDPAAATPYSVQMELGLQEGHLVLRADAVDRAGNRASITRALDIGLTAPLIAFDVPVFDGGGSFRTTQAGLTVTGSVTAPDAVKPLTFTINSMPVVLDTTGHFSWPMANLAAGSNPITALATNTFGQSATETRMVVRVQDMDDAGRPKIQIDAPIEDFSSGVSAIQVKGRVNQSGLTVQLQGSAMAVDPATLKFSGQVTLKPGPNAILATATNAAGITVTAVVHGTLVAPGTSTYGWDLPANGFHTSDRTVSITGRADLPGIASVAINGVPMQLSGSGSSGQITGDVQLVDKGVNALFMDVTTLAGEHFSERRDVIFEPIMPRIRLDAPALAKPGDTVSLKVTPEPGTTLASADLSWNGRLLQHITSPFDAVPAIVPSDAAPGARIAVEAIGTDANGETVTARTYVEIRPGGGALLVGAFDDRTGMFLAGGKATLEGGEAKDLDDHGRASFASSQPANWIRVDKANCTSVWRSAALQVGTASAVADARLTPLDLGQSAGGVDFDGSFAGGNFKLHISVANLTGTGKLSLTPLSTQGLPAMLPSGWSPVSAAWLHLEFLSLSGPASLNLTLPSVAPIQNLAWVRWDEPQHLWIVLAMGLTKDQLTALPMAAPGGYALLTADPDPISPPAPLLNQPLLGSSAPAWRDGLKATGAVDPSTMATVDAIRGLRASAQLALGFDGGTPIPSGALLQVDLMESYVLLDQNLIEPELRSSDAVACRFVLSVDANGKPQLRAATDGLALELPVRMSRTFGETDLVEGLLRAGFYHDGLQVALAGDLIGAAGGTTTHDGITLTFDPGTFTSSTFVRVLADAAGDVPALWPELAGKGRVAASFQVDIAGTLQKGLKLTIADLGNVPNGIAPILVASRILEGQRLTLAVGALRQVSGAWSLDIPAEGNALMEGGAFAVLVPAAPWAWVSGTAMIPPGTAQTLAGKVGLQTLIGRNLLSPSIPVDPRQKKLLSRGNKGMDGDKEKTKSLSTPLPVPASGPDVAIVDAVITGNLLQAASGPEGRFMLPAMLVTGKLTISGERYFLGVKGVLDVDVPSSGNTLRLATVPFRVMTILPAENSEVNLGQVFTVLLSAPVDPATLDQVKLLNGTTEVSVRRSLSLDGRMLLVTPNAPLITGTTYALVADGLTGLAGEVAPKTTRTVHTSTTPPPPNEAVDFSRIKLGYPDGNYNFTITISEGAIPAMASLSLEAPLMGSTYSGQMPPTGDLAIPFKANLGERLDITVQFPSGRKVVGNLSRYEAGDGRVTLGMDGGRINASDGSGAAVVIPAGALEEPVEFKAVFTKEPSDELLPEFQQKPILGRVQLLSAQVVTFNKVPIIEFPAPAGATGNLGDQGGLNSGIGAYAVLFLNDGFEDDGSPARWFEFLDTADVQDGKVHSRGGLPGNGDLAPVPLKLNPGASVRGALLPTVASSGCDPVGLEATPIRNFWRDILGKFAAGTPMPSNSHMPFSVTLDGMVVPNPGNVILQGRAYRKMEGDLTAKPVRGAPIFFKPGNAATTTSGRILTRTNECGHYMLMDALFSDVVIQNVGTVIGVDPDFGVNDAKPIPSVPENTDPTNGRKFFVMDDLVFRVAAANLIDHTAPWAELRIEGPLVLSDDVTRPGEFFAVVNAFDLQDRRNLFVTVSLDGKPADSSQYLPGQLATNLVVGKWKVKFTATPGTHVLEAEVKDQSGNLTRLRREIHVVEFGPELPELPSVAPSFTIEVDGALDQARPETAIKVVFTEPVKGVGPTSLFINKVGAPAGQEWVSGVKMVGSQGAVDPSQRLYTVYLIPSARLETGASYDVVGTGAIQDFEGKKVGEGLTPPQQTQRFTVTKTVPLATKTLDPNVFKLVALGGRMFGATHNQIQLIRNKDGAWKDAVAFGVTGSGGNDFLGQEIWGMGIFRQVPIAGSPVDLLLVATTPTVANEGTQQSVLWGFNACSGLEVPKLLFAVSIGVGGSGYAPTLDCRDGMIVVGRLTKSMLLVDATLAARGWNNDVTGAISAWGVNQRAIVQPFYLADPEYQWKDSQGNISMSGGAHWGVGLVARTDGYSGAAAFNVVVGYTHEGAQWRQEALKGVPSSHHEYWPGVNWAPKAPYIQDPISVIESRAHNAPPADNRTLPGAIWGADGQPKAGGRLAVWANANIVSDAGVPSTTNLIFTVSPFRPTLRVAGANVAPLGNSLVVMQKAGDERAVQKGVWPLEPPLGPGVAYEVVSRVPAVDELTGLIALPVRNTTTGAIRWFVLDFARPSAPKTVAALDGMANVGTLSNGILFTRDLSGKAQITRVVEGMASVDEGQCELFSPATVDIAMDGNRDDVIKFDDPADANTGTNTGAKYLFWVNDDNDRLEWSDLSLMYTEDDHPLNAWHTPGDWLLQGPNKNCDDSIINCKRDLEDFTGLHLKVDAHTASLSNVTYWLKFENAALGSPSVNIFEAVGETSDYLKPNGTADQQLLKSKLITVGSSEVQLLNQYIKTGGAVSPFILEGKRAGKGDLTLIAKIGGIAVGRKSIELELKGTSDFWEKHVVTTTTGDDVQTTATQVGRPTYAPTPDTGEYVLFVHGWNMGGWETDGWEKDRWAETVFKRLWWLGYKGRVGGFQWPTLGTTSYDQSELRAWNSAQALEGLITTLNVGHPGRVRVIAHSMGNVVMGEALHRMPTPVTLPTAPTVHTYIAAQAAIPVYMYDNGVPPFWPDGYNTPEIDGHYPINGRSYGQNEPSYLATNKEKLSGGRLFNYFNAKDFALVVGWRTNNRKKPDSKPNGYFYRDGDGTIDTYAPPADHFYFAGISGNRGLFFPNDRFEIFARCAQSRSQALGSERWAIDGFNPLDLESAFQFNGLHYSHSREFRSNITKEWPFWKAVGYDFQLQGKNFERRFD